MLFSGFMVVAPVFLRETRVWIWGDNRGKAGKARNLKPET